ncbi:sigma E protease regulator RseP [Aeromonas caviae]|jgi:regulator of sigma E protease|uniref:Zinc metalloprotease n=1 Tax=Aeromonas caviae TaxID=648 RepID=A0A6S4T5X7_AERCA|nr:MULTISPECIES: sigma E protease regulator RseP [Aeromonas]MBP9659599.1 sigma E protease regulator RseP [Aeromonas sp.]TXH93836.1 MAG: sigma E protease regulator RseP [Pseudorhodobacter sp.]MBL0450332.1 sigma E protease regulator RseP [Aeromonas caviae]MBL0496011.1 sigma E protease regulator RseP [Aeromonas caviae]MBL0650977.1 sigma E protease regulator RseP [Aeromonas caviae]
MGGVLWNIGAFIVALGLLVAVHEFGHFWVARRCGVKVERFSIGFGKAIWRRLGKDGTEYVLALIPLGGYVKMLDGRVDELKPGEEAQAFNHKSVWARMAIVAAGPMANFVFALFAFWLMFMIGVPSVKPVVGEVRPASIVAEAGILPGMEIVGVGGEETGDWESVTYALISHLGDDSVQLKLKAANTSYAVDKTLQLAGWKFDPDKESPIGSLGIVPLGGKVLPVVEAVVPSSASEKAGLQIGDRIKGVDGEAITEWAQFVERVQQSPAQPLQVTVERGGSEMTLTLTPDGKKVKGQLVGFVGLSPQLVPLPDEYRTLLQYGPLQALWHGVQKTWSLITLTFDMIGKLIGGIVSLDNLSGPISIAKGAGSSADYGLVYFLGFLALISVNLGIINLFPLPVLDGGHLVYFLIEAITGKPVSEKIQEVGFRIGAAILMLLMGIALFNDFARL